MFIEDGSGLMYYNKAKRHLNLYICLLNITNHHTNKVACIDVKEGLLVLFKYYNTLFHKVRTNNNSQRRV